MPADAPRIEVLVRSEASDGAVGSVAITVDRRAPGG
jgi:hypothetical protein